MEIRRVQMTGGSSFVITLPKEWINSMNVKKNDPLGLMMQSDGTLLITSKMTQDQQQRSKEFKVNNRASPTDLLRRLIGAYIAGYSSIKINSESRMPLPVRDTIRKFTQITIGQEVVEETDSLIVLKDLLNPTEMPFDRTIKRMHIIVKSMNEDAIRSLEKQDISLAKDVISRDNDVDRLHLLIARQHNIILRNVSLAEKMNITAEMSSTCFLISRIIERIGDHVVRIAKNVITLENNTFDESIITQIKTASNLAIDAFNNAIGSFFRKDIQAANKNIETVKSLEVKWKKINTLALKEEGAVTIAIGYIVESIRRIGEYAEDISESAINYLISEGK